MDDIIGLIKEEFSECSSTLPYDPKIANLYLRLVEIDKPKKRALVEDVEFCIANLFNEITSVDISQLQPGSNRMIIWEGPNHVNQKSRDFSLRFLLKGPDKGLVRGFYWLEKKGVRPLLERLRDYYAPFEVYFKHVQDKRIQIVLIWP